VLEAAHIGSAGSFVPDRLVNLGGRYSKCLREWRHNFIANFDSIVAPATLLKNREMSPATLEQFKRKFIVSVHMLRYTYVIC
jgi:cyclopropane-fatty-acyl-phospholipid synthase